MSNVQHLRLAPIGDWEIPRDDVGRPIRRLLTSCLLVPVLVTVKTNSPTVRTRTVLWTAGSDDFGRSARVHQRKMIFLWLN